MVRDFCIAALVVLLVATLTFGQCVNCSSMQKSARPCCQKHHGKSCPMPMPQNGKVCPAPDGVLSSADAQQAPDLPALAVVAIPVDLAVQQFSERIAFAPVASPPPPDLVVVHSAFLI